MHHHRKVKARPQAAAVNGALARVSRHNSARVSRGWIAYGALTAAQSPAFAAGVETRLRTSSRDQLLRELRNDLSYARRQPPGSTQAIQLILNAASADSARANHAGRRYDQIARSSNAGWIRSSARRAAPVRALTSTQDMRERLQIGALTVRPLNDAEAFGGRRFWDSLAGRDVSAPGARGRRERRDYASVTDHMLTIAALVVLDAESSERRRVSALLNEPLTQTCLEMQRLQLRQCASVSVDASERAYCLARHGLSGPGACFSSMVR